MEARANAIDWMNREVSLMLKKIPITAGDGFNYNNWEESTRFDIPDDLETLEYEDQQRFQALKTQAEQENRKTGDQWRKAKNAGNRTFYETLNLTLDECYTALNELDRVNEEKFDRNQVPGVSDLKKTLGNIITVVERVLEEKRQLEPDDEELAEEVTEEVGEDGEVVVVKKGAGVATGAIQSRQDALKRLSDVAVYFRKNEPHSPVSYLIQRAVKWGNMPLELWFQDVIKDDTVIEQLRQTLGFNTGESSDSSESSDY
jgi:type VI secretion system protein ImpA